MWGSPLARSLACVACGVWLRRTRVGPRCKHLVGRSVHVTPLSLHHVIPLSTHKVVCRRNGCCGVRWRVDTWWGVCTDMTHLPQGLQHTATHCRGKVCALIRHTYLKDCNTLQHTAVVRCVHWYDTPTSRAFTCRGYLKTCLPHTTRVPQGGVRTDKTSIPHLTRHTPQLRRHTHLMTTHAYLIFSTVIHTPSCPASRHFKAATAQGAVARVGLPACLLLRLCQNAQRRMGGGRTAQHHCLISLLAIYDGLVSCFSLPRKAQYMMRLDIFRRPCHERCCEFEEPWIQSPRLHLNVY